MKNILCVAAGAVVGAGVTAVFGANIVTKSIEKKKELSNKYIPDDILSDMIDEIKALKTIRKNISSIITTNYDDLVEQLFQFSPLVGNKILLSNPYGAVTHIVPVRSITVVILGKTVVCKR